MIPTEAAANRLRDVLVVEDDESLRESVAGLPERPLARVLVIDDERSIRELLVEHLAEEGFRTDSARSIVEARARMRERRPDAIVLDLMLPGQSGWDFLRSRSEDPYLADVPVMVISAAHPARLELARELGADAIVGKPFDLNQVTAQLRRFVRR